MMMPRLFLYAIVVSILLFVFNAAYPAEQNSNLKSLCNSSATIFLKAAHFYPSINAPIDLYLHIGRSEYPEPIPDALQWLKDVQLPNGKWARFVELYTNKPLYYDRGRIRVNSTSELSIERRTGYGYEQDLSQRLLQTAQRFERVKSLGRDKFRQEQNKALSKQEIELKMNALEPVVKKIISSQNNLGRWVTKNDRYKNYVPGVRWNGEYVVRDRISSSVFNRNIEILCNFLKLYNSLNGGGK